MSSLDLSFDPLSSTLFGTFDGIAVKMMIYKAFPLGIVKSIQENPNLHKEDLPTIFKSLGGNALQALCTEWSIISLYNGIKNEMRIPVRLDDTLDSNYSRFDYAKSTFQIYFYNSFPYHLSVFLVKTSYSFISLIFSIIKRKYEIKSIKNEEESEFYSNNFKSVVHMEIKKFSNSIKRSACVCGIMLLLETIGAAISTLITPSLYEWNCCFKPTNEVYFIFYIVCLSKKSCPHSASPDN